MPRQEHVISVFVASPSDVGDERTRLEEVIRELNTAWSRDLALRLELVRWETHSFPGIAEDAQAVINEQIPDDFDLFVGIMWCRYGTPTGRAGSGTVEEFARAKARHDANPESVRLMVYFKDEQIAPSRLDPRELEKVNQFRSSLGDEGVLYWNFTDVDQFEKLIRLHLTRQVQSWKEQFKNMQAVEQSSPTEKTPTTAADVAEDDELGILDLLEIFEIRFDELTSISERIALATEDLGEKMIQRTDEMNSLPRDSQGNVERRVAKRHISKAAADMNQYTTRIEAELPLFSEALNEGIDAFIRAAEMSVDLDVNEADRAQARDCLKAITSVHAVLTSSKESTDEFRQTVTGLPRMTGELNRAKRGVVSVLDRLIDDFCNGQKLLQEAEKVVHELLGEDGT